MRACIVVLFALASLSVHAETKHEKDERECNEKGDAAGDEALKKTPVWSPADVMRVKSAAKRAEVDKCLRSRGSAVKKAR